MKELSYELFAEGRFGRLTRHVVVDTGIAGYACALNLVDRRASLFPDGTLVIRKDFIWDFGSTPAVNTPAMVRASLTHDALCAMTEYRCAPWELRAQADRFFWRQLNEFAPRWHKHFWRYLAVRTWSAIVWVRLYGM